MKLLRNAAIAAGTAAAAASTFAAEITLPADVETTINSAQTAITTVGGYLIVLAVVALAMRWIKGAFF